MKKMLAACLLLCLTLVAAARADDLVDPPADLLKAVNQGITMLEKQQYKEFLARFMVPEQRKVILEKKTEDELVKGFAERNAAVLLEIFKSVRNQKVQLNEDGTKATWETKTPRPMVFTKIEGKWYIEN